MSTESSHNGTQTNHDPRQLTMPYVDTTLDIGWFLTNENVFFFLPIVTLFLSVPILYLLGIAWLAGLFLMLAGASLGVFIYWEVSTPAYMTIGDRLKMTVTAMRLNRTFPWSHDDPRGRTIHGVEHFYADGTAKMSDERVVGAAKIDGMNTTRITREDANKITGQLATGIDESIRDFSFSIYATTQKTDPEEVIEQYESRALGRGTHANRSFGSSYLRDLLIDVSNWFVGVDAKKWSPSEWGFYIIVAVEPHEVRDEVTLEQHSRVGRVRQWVRSHTPLSSGDEAHAEPDADSDRTIIGAQQGHHPMTDVGGAEQSALVREQRSELDLRLGRVLDACASVDGVNGELATIHDIASININYWSGEEHETGEEVLSAIGNSDNRVRPGETPAEKMIAPQDYDARDGRVSVGDQLCKTFVVREWPTQPGALFLGDFFAIRGARIDTRVHVENERKQTVIDDLENTLASIGAEHSERLEQTDVSAQQVQTDEQAVQKMLHLLLNSTTQPWKVSMYVTVRVGPEEAAEAAAATGRTFASIDMAKTYALEQACNKVARVLGKTPARCGVRSAGQSAHHAFVSSSPLGRDRYNANASSDQRTRMLGGALGAMFPWCTGTVQEDDGVRFGRNKQNGTPIRANIFEREAAGHVLTLGQTRSGKTYATETALSEWFAADPDRTLIVCDTEQGFAGLTELCGGKHIVVDSSSTINPHDIQPPSKTQQEAGPTVNNFQMKIDEVANFYCGIISAQGLSPGKYRSTIEDAARETYHKAGINRDTDTHSRDSPTPRDFIDTLEEQLHNAGAHTFTDSEKEATRKEDAITDLLDKLSGLKPGGKYDHILGETDAGILDPDTRMIYVDLSRFNEASDAEKSVMLHLILSQIYQKIKKVKGESIFLIDEAHFLLHNDEMVQYLQDAARAWARYNAALWFVTQSPRDFLERATGVEGGQENQRRTILDQCSTITAFRTPRIEPELLAELGMKPNHIRFVRKKAVTGKSEREYSECLINFQDRTGWWECHVEASPLQDHVWNYQPGKHGDFDEYMNQFAGQQSPSPGQYITSSDQDQDTDPSTTDTSETDTPTESDTTTTDRDTADSPAPSVDARQND